MKSKVQKNKICTISMQSREYTKKRCAISPRKPSFTPNKIKKNKGIG